ncbi:MAG: ABC transporter substrate-binding protein, partial [Actinomycetota bacterium]
DLLSLLALPAASAIPAGLTAAARPEVISASGPYRLADKDGYVPEHSIHLVRNEAWEESSDPVRRAWVDEISVEIGADPAEIQRRLTDGRADLSGDVGPVAAIANGVAADRVVAAPNGCLRYLFMNTRVAPFTFRSVRAAVRAALDRNAVAALQPGRGHAAASILPPTVEGYDATLAVPDAYPALARRILAGTSAFRTGFATRLVVGSRALDRQEAAAVVRALRPAGIRAAITAVPIASLYEDRYEVPAAKVPMGIATWCADWSGLGGRSMLGPLVDGRGLSSRGNTNYTGMHDVSVERTLDAALAERDPAKARAIWILADARASDVAVVVPLIHLTETSLLGPRVNGFVAHPYFVRGDLTAIWLNAS